MNRIYILNNSLSVDGGEKWEEEANGVARRFTWVELNKKLRYRVDFATANPNRTPILRNISLYYETRRKPGGTFWADSRKVEGVPAPGAAGSGESMTIAGLEDGVNYYFGLKTIDRAGNISRVSNITSAASSAPGDED